MKRGLAIALLLVIIGVICISVGTVLAQRNNVEPTTETETVITEAKTSLTVEELMSLPMPRAMHETKWENDQKVEEQFINFLEKDNFNGIMLELWPFESITAVSSAIEDGMIYTLCDVVKKDGRKAQMLLINDPITLQYVAGNWVYEDANNGYTHYEYIN